MNARLREILEGNEENYLIPLFWLRGEDESIIREEMARIAEAGIGAVCVEARPHPDFVGPLWWRNIDVVMDEARSRGMRVWVFDDGHFPTGSAAGHMKGAPEGTRRMFLKEQHIDAVGPMNQASFILRAPSNDEWNRDDIFYDRIVGVVAAKREKTGGLTGELIDLTGLVNDNRLDWDIPEGYWRIFIVVETQNGGIEHAKHYINPIVGESVRVLIDAVYEPFYVRYKDDFGGVFAGFFSDEPGFYNDAESLAFDSKIGKPKMDLPWSAEMMALLEDELGTSPLKYMPLLWHEGGESTSAIRYAYMNAVSKRYASQFSGQLGDWCRTRGVEYIGHVLEDNNVHARLGSGAGHYFRALWGQDMSGLDVVLWQLVPGFDETPFTWLGGETDSEFFHYGMAKMAASLGHLDPKKKGRTLAEVFGAYGWSEGLKLMKWMTDHLLVRGVNTFMPHSFSMKAFPDSDCPPHMYARGRNPQFRYYKELNRYTNRISHLLNGGHHIAPVAVLYHAEAEWSGEVMYFQKPVKELLQRQIDCDVVSGDMLMDQAAMVDGKLSLHEESFSCLIVPYSRSLPGGLLDRVTELANQGLLVLFMDGFPAYTSERQAHFGDALRRLSSCDRVKIVPLTGLASYLFEIGISEAMVEGEVEPYLRHYRYAHSDMEVQMFFNEHPYQNVETQVRLPLNGRTLIYDAFRNQIKASPGKDVEGKHILPVCLSPYESMIVLSGSGVEAVNVVPGPDFKVEKLSEKLSLQGNWTFSTATSEQYPVFSYWGTINALTNISDPALRNFSGTFRYELSFDMTSPFEGILLDLGEVYETAQVWLNGKELGTRICPPYQFDTLERLVARDNKLVIEVTNTLVKEQPDYFSRYAQVEPSGLIGPVKICGRKYDNDAME